LAEDNFDTSLLTTWVSLDQLCRALKVSRSGFLFLEKKHHPSPQALENQGLTVTSNYFLCRGLRFPRNGGII